MAEQTTTTQNYANGTHTVTQSQILAIKAVMDVAAECDHEGNSTDDWQGCFFDTFRIRRIEELPAAQYIPAQAWLLSLSTGADSPDLKALNEIAFRDQLTSLERKWEARRRRKEAEASNEGAVRQAVEAVEDAVAGLKEFRAAVQRLGNVACSLSSAVLNRMGLAGHGCYGRTLADTMVTGRLDRIVSELYEMHSTITAECHSLTVLAKAVDEMDADEALKGRIGAE